MVRGWGRVFEWEPCSDREVGATRKRCSPGVGRDDVYMRV